MIPKARRAAIEALFDEALADVRAAGDVALLQECRAIFRRRVPLNLRAYVAASLALGLAADGERSGKGRGRGRDRQPERRDGKGSDQRGEAPKQAKAPARDGQRPAERKASERQPAERKNADSEPPKREKRYLGEGVTLFVSAGRRQRFYARVAIRMLLDVPGVAEEHVGDIRTMDNYSFIVVDPAVEDAIIAALAGSDYKGRTLAVNRARKRGEPAPESAAGDASGDRIADGAGDGCEGEDAFSGDVGYTACEGFEDEHGNDDEAALADGGAGSSYADGDGSFDGEAGEADEEGDEPEGN